MLLPILNGAHEQVGAYGLDFEACLPDVFGMRAPLFVAFLLILAPAVVFADPTVPELMGDAQRAYIAHDYDTAKELFSEVLEMQPQNTLAIQYLRNIRLAEAGAPPKPKDPLKELMLSKIEFKDATFSAALDFFKVQAAKQSVNVSFVPQLPAPQMEHLVTLSLSNIPFLDALHYLCDLNHAVYKVEPYAIVIMPAPAEDSPAPAAQ